MMPEAQQQWQALDYFEAMGETRYPLIEHVLSTHMRCTLCGFTFAVLVEGPADWLRQGAVTHRAMIEHLGVWHREEILAEQRGVNRP
jgi:hypothetical protein